MIENDQFLMNWLSKNGYYKLVNKIYSLYFRIQRIKILVI